MVWKSKNPLQTRSLGLLLLVMLAASASGMPGNGNLRGELEEEVARTGV
jgi:hypothetical protein